MNKAGRFNVTQVVPLSTDDPRVLKLEREQTGEHRLLPEGRGAISLSLTHASLWSRFPSSGNWLYVFEDDAILQGPAELVPYILSAAERHAELQGSALLYLAMNGGVVDDFPEKRNRSYQTAHSAVRCNADGPTTWLRPCATLCLHAYAVRRGPAATLWSRVRTYLGRTGKLRSSRLQQFNADTNLRLFYQMGGAPLTAWPTCLASQNLAFSMTPSASLFVQNASEPSTIPRLTQYRELVHNLTGTDTNRTNRSAIGSGGSEAGAPEI